MAIFPNVVGAIWRGRITIPDNTGTGANLLALMRAAGYPGQDACAVKISGLTPTGAARAGFVIATPRPGAAIAAADFTTDGQGVAAGADYNEPSDMDAKVSSVRSLDASTVPAQVVACW